MPARRAPHLAAALAALLAPLLLSSTAPAAADPVLPAAGGRQLPRLHLRPGRRRDRGRSCGGLRRPAHRRDRSRWSSCPPACSDRRAANRVLPPCYAALKQRRAATSAASPAPPTTSRSSAPTTRSWPRAPGGCAATCCCSAAGACSRCPRRWSAPPVPSRGPCACCARGTHALTTVCTRPHDREAGRTFTGRGRYPGRSRLLSRITDCPPVARSSVPAAAALDRAGCARARAWSPADPAARPPGPPGSAPPGRRAVEVGVLAHPGVHGDRGGRGGVDRAGRAELRDRERRRAGRAGGLGQARALLAEEEADPARHRHRLQVLRARAGCRCPSSGTVPRAARPGRRRAARRPRGGARAGSGR